VKQVRLPWAEPMSRFTALFERLAIDVLKETSVTGAMRLLRLTWDEAWNIMDRAVERGLLAKENRIPEVIGIDEKAIAKGHEYFTLVCDLNRKAVEYVAEDRTKESLAGYFAPLTPEQREDIEAVAMDMWDPYVHVVRQYVPDADQKIVFDRFHVMGHAGKAVDKVRRREHRELKAEGDETLKGSRYLWLYSEENVPTKDRPRFEELKAEHLRTGRAWAIKESLRDLWTYLRRGWAKRFWKRWHAWAIRSRLQPIQKLAHTIKNHLTQILNYIDKPVSNGPLEAINATIETIKRRACGFRNRHHFRTAILFHCGGLQLYPVTHGEA
jgi:transposase